MQKKSTHSKFGKDLQEACQCDWMISDWVNISTASSLFISSLPTEVKTHNHSYKRPQAERLDQNTVLINPHGVNFNDTLRNQQNTH